MSYLRIKAYRLSTAGSRIQPKRFRLINKYGLDFYKKLVVYLLEKNVRTWLNIEMGGEGGRLSHAVKNNNMINTVSRFFLPSMDPVR